MKLATCRECGSRQLTQKPMVVGGKNYGAPGKWSTCVGFYSPPGHDHDDNCRHATYVCENGHQREVSRRNACTTEGCDWKGKETCRISNCGGDKFDKWPEDVTAEDWETLDV